MAWQTTPILDSGAGTDANPIGGNWVTTSGAIESNQLKRLSNQIRPAATAAASIWNTTYGADQECYVTLNTLVTGTIEYVDLCLRGTNLTTTESGYFCELRGTASAGVYDFKIYKAVANTYTTLQTTSAVSFAAGDVFGASVIGDTIRVYRNQTLVNTPLHDTAITGGGRLVLEINNASWAATNFGGGNYVPRPRLFHQVRPPLVAPAGAYLN